MSYAAVNYFEYLFFFWMDYYFEEVLKLPAETRAADLHGHSVPGHGRGDGVWRLDLGPLRPPYGYRTGRAIVPVGGMLLAAVFLLIGVALRSRLWIIVCFSIALGAGGAAEAPTWTTAVELGGRHSATAAGICNTGGNAGGLVAPVLTPLVARAFGWPAGIAVGSVVCLLGVILWRWIDPGERIAGD